MIRSRLADKLAAALARLVESGRVPRAEYGRPDIQDTKDPAHGDFACNVAMVESKRAGMNPRALAEAIAEQLAQDPDLAAVEVAGPGFINLTLAPAFLGAFVPMILERGDSLARSTPRAPTRINVEFVSVNPNGPITIGSGRGAAFGSALCNVLEAAGHSVHREYYINDGVNSEQMRLFAESVRHYVLEAAGKVSMFPEGGYRGDYVQEVSRQAMRGIDDWIRHIEWAKSKHEQALRGLQAREEFLIEAGASAMGDAAHTRQELEATRAAIAHEKEKLSHADRVIERAAEARSVAVSIVELLGDAVEALPTAAFQSRSQELMLAKQREDLAVFGVEFDTWFSEQSLHDRGEVTRRLEELVAKGAADDRPVRVKLKLAKGGAIEDVVVEQQPVGDEEGDPGAGLTALHQPGDALWMRSTKFMDDQDRVLRRRDGRLTYIASDVAYHADKFNRGGRADEPADKLITVLGPDHHGYIGRLQAVVAALLLAAPATDQGDEMTEQEQAIYRSRAERDACLAALQMAREKLEVVIFQLVRFVKDGQPAPMRKRDGNVYALIDLVEEIGKAAAPAADQTEQLRIGRDVARFFYLMRSHDTTMDFDLDLAGRQSDENPVFYVQYAHARICSVLRKAEEEGFQRAPCDWSLLAHPREGALIRKICDLPWEVERAAADYGVHRLTTYAVELARAYHHFYDACRVLSPENPELSRARIGLCQAAALGLRGALDLLGVSAPERMDRA